MKTFNEYFKVAKRTIKAMHKKGTLGKIIVILASLALLATSVLPYIL